MRWPVHEVSDNECVAYSVGRWSPQPDGSADFRPTEVHFMLEFEDGLGAVLRLSDPAASAALIGHLVKAHEGVWGKIDGGK